jgi:hypothetical protein
MEILIIMSCDVAIHCHSDVLKLIAKHTGNMSAEYLMAYKTVKGIQAVGIEFFFFILKVANIRCFIVIKCSEQEARFKKYVIMS